VFSSPAPRFSQVVVAGRKVPEAAPALRDGFVRAMNELWS
jgi:hypothetical protein